MFTNTEILQNYYIRDMGEYNGTSGFMWVCDDLDNRVSDLR